MFCGSLNAKFANKEHPQARYVSENIQLALEEARLGQTTRRKIFFVKALTAATFFGSILYVIFRKSDSVVETETPKPVESIEVELSRAEEWQPVKIEEFLLEIVCDSAIQRRLRINGQIYGPFNTSAQIRKTVEALIKAGSTAVP
jgi:hypothetical protein